MNLKTYRAPTMAAALQEVKKDLGKDAVILHTRTYKVGAVMGLGGKNVVEITASDQASAREARQRAKQGASVAERASASVDAFVPSAFATVRTRSTMAAAGSAASMRASGGAATGTAVLEAPAEASGYIEAKPVAEARAEVAPLRARIVEHDVSATPRSDRRADQSLYTDTAADALRSEIASASAGLRAMPTKPSLSTSVPVAPVDADALSVLQDELVSIKRLVGQVLQCTRTTAASVVSTNTPAGASASSVLSMGGMSDPLFAYYMKLQESLVPNDIAESIVGLVRDELAPSELSDDAVVRQVLLRRLAERLPVVGSVPRPGMQPDGRPLTLSLIGPTGVGKTTTIAKLAALFKLRHNKRVALITSDTYRIAAVDQLRTYANIIGLPLKVAMTPTEMRSALEGLAGYDVVLIDNAGRSQHDAARLSELAAFVQASRPHETHLVLSTTVSEGVLRKTCERFGALSPTRVLFTKLDEAVQLGSLVGALARTKLPVSFVTTGQEVPDQIELASSDRLARAVLDSARVCEEVAA